MERRGRQTAHSLQRELIIAIILQKRTLHFVHDDWIFMLIILKNGKYRVLRRKMNMENCVKNLRWRASGGKNFGKYE